MNEFVAAKKQMKNAMKIWYIFVPAWFVTSVIAMSLVDTLQNSYHIIASVLRFVPIIAIPIWVYVAVKMGGMQGPSHLKCQNCRAPAFERSFEVDWKFEGPTRDSHDICPNCGNDNRIDLHAP